MSKNEKQSHKSRLSLRNPSQLEAEHIPHKNTVQGRTQGEGRGAGSSPLEPTQH